MKPGIAHLLATGLLAIAGNVLAVDPSSAVAPGSASAIGTRPDSYRRVTAANFIDADAGVLAEIARVNPMAALAIDAYSPRNEPRAGSFKRGRMSFPAVPTRRTFEVSTQAASASLPADYAMAPLSKADDSAALSWTSHLLASGNLEVTFTSQEVTSDDVSVRTLYPAVKIVLSNGTPSKLVGWQVAD